MGMTTSGNTKEEKLEPCPFCGGEASESIGEMTDKETGKKIPWKYIECLDCAAMADTDDWNRRVRKSLSEWYERIEFLKNHQHYLDTLDTVIGLRRKPCPECARLNGEHEEWCSIGRNWRK